MLHVEPEFSVDAASVRVAATYVPDGAVQVGIVETHSTAAAGMPDLIQSFRAEVGRVGGDFGKVDSIRTRFEWQTRTQTQSYSCGTPQAPQTCTRVVTQNVEVGITTLMGRAFRTAGTS